MNILRKILFCLFLFFVVFSPGASAHAYIVAGIGYNEASALQDAFRNALEKKFGIELSSKTIVLNNTLVQDQTFTRTNGMIKKYTILESYPHGSQYFVRTKVELAAAAPPEAVKAPNLTAIWQHMHTATIGISIEDISTPQKKNDILTENALINALCQDGFSNTKKILSSSEDTDYVLTGTTVIAPVIMPLAVKTPVTSIGMTLHLQLVETHTGKTLFHQQYQTEAADVSKDGAVAAAKNKLIPAIGDTLESVLTQQAGTYFQQYTLHIQKYSALSTLFSFRDYLSYLHELHDISLQSFSEGNACITFSFSGDPDWLFFTLSAGFASAQIQKVSNHDIFITLP